MIRYIVTLVFALLALNAGAEVFKCTGSDAKIQFSDTPCRAGNASEIVENRMPVTPQQQQEA